MILIEKDRFPLFSVIICTYNRSGFICRALDSLLAQTEKDWEAIIVDDGSADDTFCRVKPYIDGNNRIRYIYHKNKGQALSKNAGIIASAGLYVTFLDSDDEYLPEHLASRKAILIRNPDIDLLHGGAEIIGIDYVPDIENTNLKIHLSRCVIGGTFFLTREAALALGGFPAAAFGEDRLLFDKAAAEGFGIAKTSVPTYRYHRDNPDSVCGNTARRDSFELDDSDIYQTFGLSD